MKTHLIKISLLTTIAITAVGTLPLLAGPTSGSMPFNGYGAWGIPPVRQAPVYQTTEKVPANLLASCAMKRPCVVTIVRNSKGEIVKSRMFCLRNGRRLPCSQAKS